MQASQERKARLAQRATPVPRGRRALLVLKGRKVRLVQPALPGPRAILVLRVRKETPVLREFKGLRVSQVPRAIPVLKDRLALPGWSPRKRSWKCLKNCHATTW